MTRSRRPSFRKLTLAIAVVAAMAALAAPAAHAAPAGHFGTINPAFRAWLHDRTAGPLVPATATGRSLEPLVPVPVDPVAWSQATLRRGPLTLGETSLPSS
jgi:hypothetical protein